MGVTLPYTITNGTPHDAVPVQANFEALRDGHNTHAHDGVDTPKVNFANIDGKPATYPPSTHTHPGTDVTSAVAEATHATSADNATSANSANSVPWAGVSGKPATFPPSSHQHGGGDITSAVAQASNADKIDDLHKDQLSRYVIASDTVRYQAPTERSTTSTSYQLKKSLQIAACGQIRVKGESRISNASYTAKIKIRLLNGTHSIEITTQSTTYIPFSYDMLLPYAYDQINIYLATDNAAGTAYLRNVTWCFDEASSISVLD